MNWHKKMIIRKAFALLIASLLTVLALYLSVSAINLGHDAGTVLFVFLTLFMVIVVCSTFKQLTEAVRNHKESKCIDFLSELKNANLYRSNSELLLAFQLQKNSPLYQDDKIIITNEFFAKQGENQIFVVDGILDVVPFVQKVNGMIDYVSLIFLYYDGKRYEIKYRRPFGVFNMQERVNNIKLAANIIATKSANFRKYPSYSLTN